jgi:hypothetical protein
VQIGKPAGRPEGDGLTPAPHAARRVASIVFLLGAISGPAHAVRVDLGGRPLELSGHFETRQVFRVDRDTEHELNLQVLWAGARYEISDSILFELVLSLQNGGPATRSTRGGVYDIDDVFQSVSPAFEVQEAVLSFDHESFGLRVGQIKHSWGKLDRVQPNDVINPQRFADPFLLTEVERKIGVPSIELSYELPQRPWLPGGSRLTAVWVPRYVPYRMPRPNERWFPPAATRASSFPVPGEFFGLPSDELIDVPVIFDTNNSSPPGFNLASSSYALRLTGHDGGVDYGLYYYHGYQTAPAFRLAAQAEAVDTNPLGITGRTILSPIFRRVDTWGGDFAYSWDRIALRAELAYTTGRTFNRDLRFLIDDPSTLWPQIEKAIEEIDAGAEAVPIDLGRSAVARDTVQWGVGIDYEIEGYELLLQIDQTDVINNDESLLIDDFETTALADLRKTFLRGDLALRLVAVYGISSDYTLLLPRVTYRFRDHIETQLGYLHIAGRRSSLLGQYKDNDQGFIRLRLLF